MDCQPDSVAAERGTFQLREQHNKDKRVAVADVRWRLPILTGGYVSSVRRCFQNIKNSPTCAIYDNSNIVFQLNFSIIKI